MSFNYLEIARAAEIIAAELRGHFYNALPAAVVEVELVEFPFKTPFPAPLADLNVALRLTHGRTVVCSLKQPWTAVFVGDEKLWYSSKQTWAAAFGGAADWNPVLKGRRLESIAPVAGDRVLTLKFEGGIELQIELFPARPNWILKADGVESRWRTASLPRRPMTGPPPADATAPTVREFGASADWSAGAYAHYLDLRRAAWLATQAQKGITQLQSRLAQLTKTRGHMEESLAESAKADELRAKAEALKGTLHEHPKGHRAASVTTHKGEVKLDPGLSLADNADRMFARYKKLQRTKREVEARVAGLEDEKKKVTAALSSLRGFKALEGEVFPEASKRLAQLLSEAGVAPEKAKAPVSKLEKKWEKATQKLGLRRFQSEDGVAMWVGKNHAENEELVIRIARGNDLWMHLKGRPGAHVVLQIPAGKSPSLETLLDGATLAAYYSGIPEGDKIEVDYTFRKNVKRVPGGKDKFLVTYNQNKTLMIKVEEARLWRLLKQS